jgi:hypothetical protein
MRRIARSAVVVSFVVVMGLGSRAFADDAPAGGASGPPAATLSTSGSSEKLQGLSLWGILPWGGYGAGARFMMPLPFRPLLSNTSVRDTFALEFGADFLHWSYDYTGVAGAHYSWTEVLPVVGIMWNLWLTPRFALYPKGELGYAFGWLSGWDFGGTSPTYGGLFATGAAGLLYKLENGLTFRVEAGIAGLKVGAGWLF